MLQGEGQRSNDRIAGLFNIASDLPPEEQSRFLDSNLSVSNPSDVRMRSEIERLLRHFDRSGVLDHTLVSFAGEEATEGDALASGEIIAQRFQIVRLIGSGGMGEVYEAVDLAIRQTVALKTIRADLAGESDQAERFRRELLISRNLAHRNVCRVFDYEDIDRDGKRRLRFFTMELLQGETLAQRIAARGRLDPAVALAILQDVAEGLHEVHRNGIVHRDLKPSNIFLVREADGHERAVVMDFGLARSLTEDDLRQTSTEMVLGTRLYMAPESSKSAGISSDIFSFGVMALEMVTGSPSPIVSPCSVVRSLDPAWDKALEACFRLDPAARPTDALAVVQLLRRKTRLWRRLALAASLAATCTLAGAAAWRSINPPPAPPPAFTRITSDPGLTIDPTSTGDGKMIAYASDRGSAGNLNIWVQNVETGEATQITNGLEDENEPSISADGRLIAWHAGRDNTLYVRQVSGGVPRAIAQHALTPRLSPDGRFVAYWTGLDERYVPASAWVVPVSGGAPRNVAPGFVDARLPIWAPDSKSILFRGAITASPSIYKAQDWWFASVDGKSMRRTGLGPRLRSAHLEPHESAAIWDGSRATLVAKSGDGINLFSLRLPAFLRMPIGSPQALTTGAGHQDSPAALSDGRIAYADWDEQTHIFRVDLASSELKPITKEKSTDTRISLSADGNVLVFGRRIGSGRNVWIKDLRSGTERKLADNELAVPSVSPDGRTVAMSVDQAIRLIDVASSRQNLICGNCGEVRGWIDARHILYLENMPNALPALRVFEPETNTRRTLVSVRGLNEGAVSPGGHMVAFTTRINGDSTIFIAKLVDGSAVRPWLQLIPDDVWADKPVWSSDEKTLYFASKLDGFECLWSQKIDTKSFRTAGKAIAVQHFHSHSMGLTELTPSTANLALSGQNLFFSVELATANILAVRP